MLPNVGATISKMFFKYSWHLHHTFTNFQTKTAVSFFQTVFSYFNSMKIIGLILVVKCLVESTSYPLHGIQKKSQSYPTKEERVIFMNPQYLLIGARKTVRTSNWILLSLQLSTILSNSSKTEQFDSRMFLKYKTCPPCHKQNYNIKTQTIMLTLLLTLRFDKYSYLCNEKKFNPYIWT